MPAAPAKWLHAQEPAVTTRALEDTGGNQLQAARRLGIGRETLRRRLSELGLHVSRRLEAEEDAQP